ncbi:hypothetical protein H0N99_00705 [Candidatus Micrarchaeota archaeon]|nr:hypothetical protein [Candidatus Micrarchaeota archaeon]
MIKAQSAMEFITTYGWMALILIIVLAALAYLGMFSQPKPVMCNFPGNFICRSMKLTTTGNLTLDLYQDTGHDITVSGVNCTKNFGTNPSLTAVNVFIKNSDHDLIANGTNVPCFDATENIAIGAVNGHYSGKILIYYTENDTGMSHLVAGDITMTYE